MSLRSSFLQVMIFPLLLALPGKGRSQLDPSHLYVLDSSLCPGPALTRCLLTHKFILVGEMHGTCEPVRFLVQCARILSLYKEVNVGFEMARDDSSKGPNAISAQWLEQHPLFVQGTDGRFSSAWRDAMLELLAIPHVSVFFFDADRKPHMDRDSAMYMNLREVHLRDTGAVVLTVSGNIHSRVQPYNGIKPMGYYVQSYLDRRVLALTHRYQKGSMYNAAGGNARLQNIDHGHDGLSELSPGGNFFYDDPLFQLSVAWNGFLYTRKINAAFPVKNK